MENSESWRMMLARMNRLGNLLDSLTHKAMDLLTVWPCGNQVLQQEMTVMRIEARRLVKEIRGTVQREKSRK